MNEGSNFGNRGGKTVKGGGKIMNREEILWMGKKYREYREKKRGINNVNGGRNTVNGRNGTVNGRERKYLRMNDKLTELQNSRLKILQ